MTQPVTGPDDASSGAAASGADFRILELLSSAVAGRLVVFAGAGISLDSGLPLAETLSEEIFDYFADHGVQLGGVERTDLLQVSDVVAANGGLGALQGVANAAYPFDTASPASTHRALALLLLEGAIQLLTQNWDTCVERAAAPERITSVVTTEERFQIRGGGSLLKVHGCTTRQQSLLITSQQLDQPPVWADSEIAASLSQSTVVFIGIGDVAPYVRRRLQQIVDAAGNATRVFVVSPSIVSKWAGSQWSGLLAELPDDHRVAMTGEDFSRALIGAWLNDALSKIRRLVRESGNDHLVAAFPAFLGRLQAEDPSKCVGWIRSRHVRPTSGTDLSHHRTTGEALMALALISAGDGIDAMCPTGPLRLDSGAIVDIVATADLMSGISLSEEALKRVDGYSLSGMIAPNDTLKVVCAGSFGALPGEAGVGPPQDVLGEESGIVGGNRVILVSSSSVLAEVA